MHSLTLQEAAFLFLVHNFGLENKPESFGQVVFLSWKKNIHQKIVLILWRVTITFHKFKSDVAPINCFKIVYGMRKYKRLLSFKVFNALQY